MKNLILLIIFILTSVVVHASETKTITCVAGFKHRDTKKLGLTLEPNGKGEIHVFKQTFASRLAEIVHALAYEKRMDGSVGDWNGFEYKTLLKETFTHEGSFPEKLNFKTSNGDAIEVQIGSTYARMGTGTLEAADVARIILNGKEMRPATCFRDRL